MVLFSKLDFNLPIGTTNSKFLEIIFCAVQTNVGWKMPLFDAMILSVWKMTRLFVEFCFAKFQSYFFVTCICEFGQSLLVLLFFCLFNFYYLEKVGVQLSQRSRYCFSVFLCASEISTLRMSLLLKAFCFRSVVAEASPP